VLQRNIRGRREATSRQSGLSISNTSDRSGRLDIHSCTARFGSAVWFDGAAAAAAFASVGAKRRARLDSGSLLLLRLRRRVALVLPCLFVFFFLSLSLS